MMFTFIYTFMIVTTNYIMVKTLQTLYTHFFKI